MKYLLRNHFTHEQRHNASHALIAWSYTIQI